MSTPAQFPPHYYRRNHHVSGFPDWIFPPIHFNKHYWVASECQGLRWVTGDSKMNKIFAPLMTSIKPYPISYLKTSQNSQIWIIFHLWNNFACLCWFISYLLFKCLLVLLYTGNHSRTRLPIIHTLQKPKKLLQSALLIIMQAHAHHSPSWALHFSSTHLLAILPLAKHVPALWPLHKSFFLQVGNSLCPLSSGVMFPSHWGSPWPPHLML